MRAFPLFPIISAPSLAKNRASCQTIALLVIPNVHAYYILHDVLEFCKGYTSCTTSSTLKHFASSQTNAASRKPLLDWATPNRPSAKSSSIWHRPVQKVALGRSNKRRGHHVAVCGTRSHRGSTVIRGARSRNPQPRFRPHSNRNHIEHRNPLAAENHRGVSSRLPWPSLRTGLGRLRRARKRTCKRTHRLRILPIANPLPLTRNAP